MAKKKVESDTEKVALRLDKDSIALLKKLEDEHAVNFSAAIRMAVREWLANHPLLKGKK